MRRQNSHALEFSGQSLTGMWRHCVKRLSAEHYVHDEGCGEDPCYVCDEAGRNSVACIFDANSSVVDREHIKGGFGAALVCAHHVSDEGIWSV